MYGNALEHHRGNRADKCAPGYFMSLYLYDEFLSVQVPRYFGRIGVGSGVGMEGVPLLYAPAFNSRQWSVRNSFDMFL
jgi:hypothetical protein